MHIEISEKVQDALERAAVDLLERVQALGLSSGRYGKGWRDFIHEGHAAISESSEKPSLRG
jgi:hypothetical protein